MSLYPGTTIRNYIDGHRKRYTKPVQFYMLVVTVYFFLNAWIGIDYGKIQEEMGTASAAGNAKAMAFANKINAFIIDNYKLLLSLSIPFFALSLKWFYKSSRYNYVELLVFSLYISAITYIQSEILSFIYLATNSFNTYVLISTTANVIFATYAINQFFQRRGVLAIIRSLFCYGVSLVIFMIFLTVVVIIAGIVYAAWVS